MKVPLQQQLWQRCRYSMYGLEHWGKSKRSLTVSCLLLQTDSSHHHKSPAERVIITQSEVSLVWVISLQHRHRYVYPHQIRVGLSHFPQRGAKLHLVNWKKRKEKTLHLVCQVKKNYIISHQQVKGVTCPFITSLNQTSGVSQHLDKTTRKLFWFGSIMTEHYG